MSDVTPNDIREAIGRCAAYDPAHFPRPSAAMTAMWIDHFQQFHGVTVDDLKAAVREYYNRPSQPVPQPADISAIARKYVRERYERSELGSIDRQRFEDLCDGKAEPERPAITSARHTAILGYARKFGISPAEASVRMEPDQGDRNEMDARRVEIAHRRIEPPAPIRCPDCGSIDVPCPCEEAEYVG